MNDQELSGTESPEKIEDQLRLANEKMYEHSLELATRNKTLSLLRQLYQISILTLDPKTLSDKIVVTIREALDFELVSIYNYDVEGNVLVPFVFTRSERLNEAVGHDHPFQSHSIPDASNHPFFTKLLEGLPNYSTDLHELWGGTISEEILERAITVVRIKTLLAYPIRINNKMTDVLVMCFNREYNELTKFEQESLESIIDVVAVALDRSRVYEELQHLNGELTDSNKQQVTLIHFITHQLKGFVSKSRNIFAMISEGDYGEVPAAMKPMIDEGFASSTKGAQTIQEILNAANIKNGKVAYAKQSFDFKALIDGIAANLKPNADAKNVVLTVIEPEEPVMFTGDQMQLENAIKNMVDNTIKYTPQGSIKVSLTKDEKTIRFMTEDTGVGITPEDMTHLFTEGGHGSESQKVNVDSTGFGLYIVKNIIEAHGGKVWAESEGAGKGSRFIVELPVEAQKA
jgi:signal transduction histidine kinase